MPTVAHSGCNDDPAGRTPADCVLCAPSVRRRLKKRHGHADPLLTEKEVELKAAAAAAGPRFGEQAYQPLKVQLKRKHWAGEGAEEASRSRLTQLFDRQMSQARAAAAAAEAARDDGARPQPPRSKAAGGGGKKKQRGPAAPPDEAVRQQLIDTYRHQKLQRLQASGKAPLLSATAQSLAELVRRDAGKDSFHR